MGAVTPGETLGTLYNIHVGFNKTKQHGETLGTTIVTLYNRDRDRDIHVGSNKTKQHTPNGPRAASVTVPYTTS